MLLQDQKRDPQQDCWLSSFVYTCRNEQTIGTRYLKLYITASFT